MNVQPWRTAAMLLAACGLLSSCRLAKQRVDFTWFRDACTSPQNDTVHIEAGRGLPQSSAPAAPAKRQWMPWQQQQKEAALSPWQEPRQQTTYAPPAAAASSVASYTVQPGDTLSGIARKCHVSLASLYAANGLNAETARGLRPGQMLRVPRPAAHGAALAAAQQPVAPRQQASAGYAVRKGDTLSGIAARHHTTTAELIRANRLTPQQANRLKIGQKLIIPRH